MLYAIHQVIITKEEAELINAMADPHSHPKMAARRYMESPEEAAKAFEAGLYDKVALIEADDLDGVFQIGNMGPEDKIQRYGPMHSVSVNDIIEDDDGVLHVVQSVGFAEVKLSESV